MSIYQHDSDSRPPVVREQDIETDFVEKLRSLKYEYRPDIRDRERSQVFIDDLLVTIVGANTAHCCRVPEKLSERYVCQSVALIRPVLPSTARFLELFLSSTGPGLAEWRKWIYGEGRPHLSFDNLCETLVYLPPLAEQKGIVRRVKELFALAQQIEARYAKVKAYIDKLTQSILAKAFRGELVSQDPEDEPASIPLARIRQQRNGNKDKTYDKAKTKRANSVRNRRPASRELSRGAPTTRSHSKLSIQKRVVNSERSR